MRVDRNFYIIDCLDVIALINVTSNVALQCFGSSAVTYVFLSLDLTEIKTRYADTKALSKAWKTEKKNCAMPITASVVRSEEGFIQSRFLSLHCG